MWLFLNFMLLMENQDLIPKTEYRVPEGTYLADPHFMDFSPQGELFLLERNSAKIHRWSSTGEYLGSFGKKGDGPGEMDSPRLIHLTRDQLWVWDPRFRFLIFNHQGDFIRDFRSPQQLIRRFAVLDKGRILAAYQTRQPQGATMIFALTGEGSRILNSVKSFKNEMFISTIRGDDHGTIKAYGPEIDIHRDPEGDIWFGFSQNNVLYHMNPGGKIVSQKAFAFPASKPSDEEREAFESIEVPGPEGRPITLKNLPNLSVSFDYDKAFYTHLLIGEKRLAAVLTPVSGNDQNKGYYRGSYYIMDRDSGKPVDRGSFHLPEGSILLINNGRALACSLDESGEFSVREVALRGMEP